MEWGGRGIAAGLRAALRGALRVGVYRAPVRRALFGRGSAVPLALFRVAVAGVALVNVWDLYRDRALFARHVILPTLDRLPAEPLLGTWALALFGVLAGVGTRWCAAVHVVLSVYVLGLNLLDGFAVQTADGMLLTQAWAVLLLPVSRALAIDAWRAGGRHGTVPRSIAVVCGLFLAGVYLDSGLRKLWSPMWTAGLGLWAPATLPHFVHLPLPLLDHPIVMRAAGWAVVAFEIGFGPLLGWRRTRTATLCAGMTFHALIALVYPFPLFGCAMLAWYVPLLPVRRSLAFERTDAARRVTSIRGARSSRRAAATAVVATVLLVTVWGFFATSIGIPRGHARVHDGVVGQALYRVAGFWEHGVFDDELFATQDTQVDLRLWVGDRALPSAAVSPAGFFPRATRDRAWEYYWKQVVFPTHDHRRVEAGLAGWARYLVWAHGGPTGGLRATVRARRQESAPVRWAAGRLDRNLRAPWRSVAKLRAGTADTLVWRWRRPVADGATSWRTAVRAQLDAYAKTPVPMAAAISSSVMPANSR